MENCICIPIILTNDVSPRDSQDDKLLPKHIKINLKNIFPFKYKDFKIKMNSAEKPKAFIFHIVQKKSECVCEFYESNIQSKAKYPERQTYAYGNHK